MQVTIKQGLLVVSLAVANFGFANNAPVATVPAQEVQKEVVKVEEAKVAAPAPEVAKEAAKVEAKATAKPAKKESKEVVVEPKKETSAPAASTKK